jgi:hypothetical protein
MFMKGKKFFRSSLKKLFPSNPLSYLGWLGILGILGIFFVPVFIPFLLFFTFFSYKSMKADELFWENVRRASTRGFWIVFAVITGGMFIMFLRGMTIGARQEYVEATIQGNLAIVGVFQLEQYMLSFILLILSMVLMILVFSISMLQFRRKEKKLLEQEQEMR